MEKWCSRPELNRDGAFRKRELYPFELREQPARSKLAVSQTADKIAGRAFSHGFLPDNESGELVSAGKHGYFEAVLLPQLKWIEQRISNSIFTCFRWFEGVSKSFIFTSLLWYKSQGDQPSVQEHGLNTIRQHFLVDSEGGVTDPV